jgi:hypothetical protein
MEIIQDGNCGGKLYTCLLTLVDMTRERQKELDSVLGFLPKIKRAKEYSTIKLCSYRGAGHTSAIIKIIEEKFDKVILILPNARIEAMLFRLNPELKNKVFVCSPNRLERIMGVSDYQAVIVDCSSLISQSRIEEIYNITSFGPENPLYIFME